MLNNIIIFNVGQRQSNVVKMTISKKKKKKSFQIEFTEFKVLALIL